MKRAIDTTTSGFSARAVKAAKKAGVSVVIGYVAGGGAWKHMTKPFVAAFQKAGIDIACCYEAGAGWMLGGRSAGIRAAKNSIPAVAALGGPKDFFLWLACDTDTTDYGAINECLAGAVSVLGKKRVGIYGGFDVCEEALATKSCAKAWQTLAWSGGRHLKTAALYQYAGAPWGPMGGMDYDANDMLAADVGQWAFKPPVPKFYVDVQATRILPWGATQLEKVAAAARAGQAIAKPTPVFGKPSIVRRWPLLVLRYGPWDKLEDANLARYGAKRGLAATPSLKKFPPANIRVVEA
jgi:hypothetical protein